MQHAGTPDTTWDFSYVDGHRDGRVPREWRATVKFGTSATHRVELRVLVMDVGAAATFWAAHQSTDGRFASAPNLPPGANIVTVLRLYQTPVDRC